MNRKSEKKRDRRAEGTTQAGYYDLKTKAVKDLVEADESNSPPVSDEELRRYRSGPRFRVGDRVKLLFIKFWFAGAVCFFIVWGLSGYMSSYLDTLVITAITMGMVTDILTNNALRFFAPTPGANDRYIMVTKRGWASLFLNILYAFAVVFLVYTMYAMINIVLLRLTGLTDTVLLGVEPILFGLFYLGADLLLIRCKDKISVRRRTADR